jgi:hypothetical protein
MLLEFVVIILKEYFTKFKNSSVSEMWFLFYNAITVTYDPKIITDFCI